MDTNNIDKTELIRITTSQQLTANGIESLFLDAKNSKGENIKLSKGAKILGITFQNNLSWNCQFEKGSGPYLINVRKSWER